MNEDMLNTETESEMLEEKANEIIEVDENEEINNTEYDVSSNEVSGKEEKKKKKVSKSNKDNKKKIIIIVSIVLVLLIVIGIVLCFTVFKSKEDKDDKKPDEPIVIVEKENYKYENGFLVFIDSNKNELGKYECTNKDEKLCYVVNYSNEEEFDESKNVYEDGSNINTISDIFSNKYAFIYDNELENKEVILYNFIDKKTEDKYDLVKEVSEDKVIVSKDGKYGLLTFTSNYEESIKLEYDYMGHIKDKESLVVAKNSNYQVIDYNGDNISKKVPGEIKNYSDKLISVSNNGNYYIYDYESKKVIESSFDYIRFIDGYSIALKNNKLYVYDVDGAIMNGEGIEISSKDYNTKIIFNKELRQVGKEEAFNAYLSNSNTLRIEYDDTFTNINLSEGKFNKTLSYINYFDGRLYFYSDEKKTKLIGTYACKYSNAVSENTEALEYCFLAKESNFFKSNEEIDNGYIPIFNERFVFIADTKTPNTNDNIVVYDLNYYSNQKKDGYMITYKAVDTGFHNTEKDVNFVETAGTEVIAKNLSDSYLMVNITSNKIKKLIDSKYGDNDDIINVSVKAIDDNYLVFKRSDETYHLYNMSGTEITNKVTTKNEIIEYKYDHIKVKDNNNNYLLYSLDGKVISNESKYIVMESKFYLSVVDNIVKVMKYSDNTINLLESEVTVNSEDYENVISYTVNGDVLNLKVNDTEYEINIS